MKCIVCKEKDLDNYCTTNVCQTCCEAMKCPTRYKCNAYIEIIEKKINKFKSGIDFYKRYKYNEKLFSKEQTEIWRDNWMCTIEGVNAGEYSKEDNIKNYNRWLFEYCFGDMIKNV